MGAILFLVLERNFSLGLVLASKSRSYTTYSTFDPGQHLIRVAMKRILFGKSKKKH